MRHWLRRVFCLHRGMTFEPLCYNPYCPRCRTTFVVDAS